MAELIDHQAQKALTIFREIHDPSLGLSGLAIAEHSLGHARESEAALSELIKTLAGASAYQIAEVYGWRGDRENAFAWLERGHVQHDAGLTYLKMDPLMDSLREDPRYRALLRKMKLPE